MRPATNVYEAGTECWPHEVESGRRVHQRRTNVRAQVGPKPFRNWYVIVERARHKPENALFSAGSEAFWARSSWLRSATFTGCGFSSPSVPSSSRLGPSAWTGACVRAHTSETAAFGAASQRFRLVYTSRKIVSRAVVQSKLGACLWWRSRVRLKRNMETTTRVSVIEP